MLYGGRVGCSSAPTGTVVPAGSWDEVIAASFVLELCSG